MSNYSDLNIHEKVLKIKIDLDQQDIPKSGKNNFSKFAYHELEDIIPPLHELFVKYNVDVQFSFIGDKAVCNVINLDDVDNIKEIEIPIPEINEMNKGMNIMQSLGSYTTYLRRYLLLIMFDITEKCTVDSAEQKDNNTPKSNVSKNNTSNLKNNKKTDEPKFLRSMITAITKNGKKATIGSLNIEITKLIKNNAISKKDAIGIRKYVKDHPEVLV
ncbi:MAG: ERF family protein [Methanobacteriaceae archaeon]|jgi:hypothetical protein|nr:ERF family protein [Methanobacteriaceae archaeon]